MLSLAQETAPTQAGVTSPPSSSEGLDTAQQQPTFKENPWCPGKKITSKHAKRKVEQVAR